MISVSSITNSYATGSVASSSSLNPYAGGLVGWIRNSSIMNSYATGSVVASAVDVSANVYAGGLVALVSSSTNYITNSYATGSVSATGGEGKTYQDALIITHIGGDAEIEPSGDRDAVGG